MGKLLDKFSKVSRIKEVKLIYASCGEIMIDGLPFSFSVESAGLESAKGLTVAISGEDVDNGKITFSKLEYHEMHNGKVTVVEKDFPLITKKDGKKIYSAKFLKIPLTEFTTGPLFHKTTEEEIIQRVNSAISFNVTPHYSGEDEPEVMLTVYPNENALNGSCVEWRKVTSDKDYFIHKYRQEK